MGLMYSTTMYELRISLGNKTISTDAGVDTDTGISTDVEGEVYEGLAGEGEVEAEAEAQPEIRTYTFTVQRTISINLGAKRICNVVGQHSIARHSQQSHHSTKENAKTLKTNGTLQDVSCQSSRRLRYTIVVVS